METCENLRKLPCRSVLPRALRCWCEVKTCRGLETVLPWALGRGLAEAAVLHRKSGSFCGRVRCCRVATRSAASRSAGSLAIGLATLTLLVVCRWTDFLRTHQHWTETKQW